MAAVTWRDVLLGYLAAYATVAAIAMGALILLLIGYATNARWLSTMRRLQEAIVGVFPLLAVLFLPIAIGVEHIYVWADLPADLPAHDRELIATKQAWLQPAGFILRSALYLAVLIVAAEVMRRRSLRRDAVVPTGDPEAVLGRDRAIASALLVPVGLALTFAAIDWLMSLQPTWVSSMFPVYYFAGGFVAAIALLAMLAARYREQLGLTGHHFHALGRMLFAFVVFWGYTAYFQGFLIQIANRPTEVTFFVARTHAGWGSVLIAILLARFALPFFLLLPRFLKYRPHYVSAIAAIVLAGHVLDMAWLVMPSRDGPLWPAISALIVIAGACVAFAAWRTRRVPLVAVGDPFLAKGLRYESST